MTRVPNWVDLVVLTILFTKCYNGFHRGFFTELFRLVGLVATTTLVVNYTRVVVGSIQSWLGSNQTLISFMVFWICFLGGILLVHLAVAAAARLITWERIYWVTQLSGLVFGALQGLWWSGLLLITLTTSGFVYVQESVEQRSVFGPHVLSMWRQQLEYVSGTLPGAPNRWSTVVPPMRMRASH